jgi:hypothetical protein
VHASVIYLFHLLARTLHMAPSPPRLPYVHMSMLFPYEFRLQYVRGMHWAMPAQVQIL